ncbi:UNVERIFIED_CONTAM: hypothetical protein FKN15_017457 [Acipenser sinensis]
MKKLFSFGKKKKGLSPNTSDTGSVVSAGYELKEKDLGKLHKAASTGDLSKLKQLAKKHDLSQLDKDNRTPLHLACAHGHVDVVHFLMESKAKLNLCDNDNRSPLMKAVQCQQERCVVTLLEHDADPNLVDINGNTALHLAALIPAISMAIQLLDHDARINATNKDGCTPLILAATENHQEMVEFLLKEGADVDAKDKSKRTSLMITANNGQISLVRLLLRYDADISIKDDKGWTADDYAVMNGHHATSLMITANNGQISLVRLLLRYDADISIKDDKGWTADDYAVMNGHHACSHLIIEHGTKKRPPQSPHFYGTSKVKGASVFSSPIRGTESGFAVGGPATDKEVGDNISQEESISRVSDKGGAADSWPSSDEGEELDFSPKKLQKPSLTKLMNASQKSKNNVNENGNARPQPVEHSESIISGSEGDSEKESENEDEKDHSPPKAFPTSLHPANPSPASFSKLPQMTSTPLRNSKQTGTVCDEPGVLEKATTSRQSCAEQEENESENEEEDEDEEGGDEEDLDEEEDEEEEASEEDDGGVASLEHENHERAGITVANPCSVVGKTIDGQETISAARGTSVAKGEVSAGEVVAGRDENVAINEGEEYSDEEEEEEYEDLHISGKILKESGTVGSAVPPNDLDEKGSPAKNIKRDFLSELGLAAAEEDEDSPWDSESASDSPRKQQSGALNPAAKAQTVMHSISEEKNEDASDWDSASTASRNLPGCKILSPVRDEISAKLSEPELATPQKKTPNIVQCAKADQKTSAEKSLSPSNSPPLPEARSLHSLTSQQPQPQPQPRSKLLAVKADSGEGKPTLNIEMCSSKRTCSFSMCLPMLLKDKELLETPLAVLINTSPDAADQADAQLREQNQEGSENQTTDKVNLSAASSALPWEERYEKIWVENEKREVKSHYKDVAAELKKKFGEICLEQSRQPSSISTHLRVDLNKEDDSSDEDEIVHQMAMTQSGILQPIPEQESSLEDSITERETSETSSTELCYQ